MTSTSKTHLVTKLSSCKTILLLVLDNYSSLKEAFLDLYGTPLFESLPIGNRNCILNEYFREGEFYKKVCEKYLDLENILEEEEVRNILLKDFDYLPIYRYYVLNYSPKYFKNEFSIDLDLNKILPKEEQKRNKIIEYTLLYYEEMDSQLEEERLGINYLFGLKKAFEKKRISYLESLNLLPKNQMTFLQSSQLPAKDIYDYFLRQFKSEGKEEGEI